MEKYSGLSIFELRNKLRNYGYRGYSNMSKEQLENSVFIAEIENELYPNFTANPVDYSKFATGRCNAIRRQRFVPKSYKDILHVILFSGMIEGVDFTEEQISEYVWLSVHIKNNDETYVNAFLKLNNGMYIYLNFSIKNTNQIEYNLSKDMNYKNIVNNVMNNKQYYWYRHSTELQDQILMNRNVGIRSGSNFQENIDYLVYIMFKLKKYDNVKVINLQDDETIKFDYMKNFSKIYWIHFNLNNNEKNYILYKTGTNVYTLLIFKYNMKKIEDIPEGELLMSVAYISNNYEDIIKKALYHKEYEMYISETN